MKKLKISLAFIGISLIVGCGVTDPSAKSMTDEQATKLVKHSVQYVAMYNVNNKFALDDNNPMSTHGWNKTYAAPELMDHNVKAIARPNNDTLYTISMLDLRDEPVIVKLPAFDSRYVSLMTSAYDHYVNIPMSNLSGDFKEPETVMFYSGLTKNVPAQLPQGVDRSFEMTGNFVTSLIRIMPHANEPKRLAKNLAAMRKIEALTLSEFQGGEAKTSPLIQPDFGATDIAIYQNNFAEVMQFVVNNTVFDPNNADDVETLAVLAKVGIAAGQEKPTEGELAIDSDQLAQAATQFYQSQLAAFVEADQDFLNKIIPAINQPKGITTSEVIQLVSVVGPIGMPIQEASYLPIASTDGQEVNALNDYVIRIAAEDMPPVHAFWSITLYDKAHGFFIPNDDKKYSVGENAGFELNAVGGIDIYIAAEKPAGVPAANWLPINRQDEDLTAMIRLYNPILTKMDAWKAPVIEKL